MQTKREVINLSPLFPDPIDPGSNSFVPYTILCDRPGNVTAGQPVYRTGPNRLGYRDLRWHYPCYSYSTRARNGFRAAAASAFVLLTFLVIVVASTYIVVKERRARTEIERLAA